MNTTRKQADVTAQAFIEPRALQGLSAKQVAYFMAAEERAWINKVRALGAKEVSTSGWHKQTDGRWTMQLEGWKGQGVK